MTRNFYGSLRITDSDENDGMGMRRTLTHGVIVHGEQLLDPQNHNTPSTYYCPGTAAGAVLESPDNSPRRVGLLGLGAGTLLYYGRSGDTYRVYEINPTIVTVARNQFYFLHDSQARVEIVPGDARLSLEQEPPQQYDVLVLDAFSGDAIPVHLLTLEAFATYFRHLKPSGILALHVSNEYLDLVPVVERAARHYGKLAVRYMYSNEENDTVCSKADWILVTDPGNRAALPEFDESDVLKATTPGRPWTDDYSSLWGIIQRSADTTKDTD